MEFTMIYFRHALLWLSAAALAIVLGACGMISVNPDLALTAYAPQKIQIAGRPVVALVLGSGALRVLRTSA